VNAATWSDIEAALAQHRFDDAVAALEQRLAANPADALAELRLGSALTEMHRYASAKEHFDRAEKLGIAPGALAWRRALLFAQTGERDAAFAQLDRALERGIGPATQAASEPLLEPLRGDARFAAFIERYDRAIAPCRHDAHYRELDFWIGTWDVRPNGAATDSPASENVITLDYDACVVQEHWRSVAGGTGSSFNIYDASRKAWFQTWVDSGGGLHEYRGNPDAAGNMVFAGEVPGSAGQPARVPTRLTLFRQGADRVRQFSQSSLDGGNTWTTNYDLIYTRRPARQAEGVTPNSRPNADVKWL
jgi:tetratricopeptide (TPR) repeat protein